ncbi:MULTISPECIES: carbohydrate ABC transporter permease [Micrococcaceae]|uniref:carbohydrate ABC transporter permease n=1 Tax=Micrococcaceae TaxID=1268 RepID=UPI0027836475|nr:MULTISPECIES: sugar ABC transporter permease [Micrococcaceae]MDQ0078626.1 multiple sugar transport system permease protein [Arthrobacter oryzae]MDR6417658.1 multiple sugar transport system permease protein [Pseudarthrobacter sulfonivorans]
MSTNSRTRTSSQTATPPTGVQAFRRARKDRMVWLYVVPVTAVFLFVFVGPLIYTAWTALHETSYYQIGKFSGLNSFAELFADSELPARIWTTLVFSIGALVIALPAGLLSAIVLNNLHRFKRSIRSLFLLPWLLSQATAGTIWLWFLNPNYGPASAITQALGFGPTDVFSSPNSALVAVTLMTAWWSYPQAMLLFLGALQTIPVELYESLKVDGGGIRHAFLNVTLPHLRNTIVSVVIVLLMLYVQMVTIILVTTRGGPIGSTETLSMRVYNQMFDKFDLSGASATAILLFAVNIVLTLVAIRFRRKESL